MTPKIQYHCVFGGMSYWHIIDNIILFIILIESPSIFKKK